MSVFSACLKLQANSSFWEQNDFFSGEEPNLPHLTPLDAYGVSLPPYWNPKYPIVYL